MKTNDKVPADSQQDLPPKAVPAQKSSDYLEQNFLRSRSKLPSQLNPTDETSNQQSQSSASPNFKRELKFNKERQSREVKKHITQPSSHVLDDQQQLDLPYWQRETYKTYKSIKHV